MFPPARESASNAAAIAFATQNSCCFFKSLDAGALVCACIHGPEHINQRTKWNRQWDAKGPNLHSLDWTKVGLVRRKWSNGRWFAPPPGCRIKANGCRGPAGRRTCLQHERSELISIRGVEILLPAAGSL